MQRVYSDTVRLHEVIKWLIRSHEKTGKKGFSVGFDIRKGWLAPYSETTGYIIPTLYRYADLYNSSEAFEIATAAVRWLISIQNPDGSVNDFAGSATNPRQRPPVIFNTGQDLFGLLSAYNATKDSAFMEAGKKAAMWIIAQQEKKGLWNDTTSYGSSGLAAYYSHVTWPVFALGKAAGDKTIMDNAQIGLQQVIDLINPNLSVKNWGFKAGSPAFTHTIAYTIEGLLEQGLLSGGTESAGFVQSKKIADKTIELLDKDGRMAGSYDEAWKGDFSYTCMPGNCQLALIYFRLHELLKEPSYINAADRVMAPVIKRQHISAVSPSAIRGTIPASWLPLHGKYMRWLYPNWAAKYFADSLMARTETARGIQSNGSGNEYYKLLERFPG